MFSVLINDNDGVRNRLAFKRKEITIGRIRGNDIILPKGNISKKHCKIFFKGDKFIVTDLQSTNGTFVNGYKINAPTVLREGDRIYIGEFILTLFLEKEKDEKEKKPSSPEKNQYYEGLSPIIPPQKNQKTLQSESIVQPIPPKEKKSTLEEIEQFSPPTTEKDSPKKVHSETIASPSPISFMDKPHSSSMEPEREQNTSQPMHRPTEVQDILHTNGEKSLQTQIWFSLFADSCIEQIHIDVHGKVWIKEEAQFFTRESTFLSLQNAVHSLKTYLRGQGSFFVEKETTLEATILGKLKITCFLPPVFSSGLCVFVERWKVAQPFEILKEKKIIDQETLDTFVQIANEEKKIFLVGEHTEPLQLLFGAILLQNQNSKIVLFENKPTVEINIPGFFRFTESDIFNPSNFFSSSKTMVISQEVKVFLSELSLKEMEKLISCPATQENNFSEDFLQSFTAAIVKTNAPKSVENTLDSLKNAQSVTWLKKYDAVLVSIEKPEKNSPQLRVTFHN